MSSQTVVNTKLLLLFVINFNILYIILLECELMLIPHVDACDRPLHLVAVAYRFAFNCLKIYHTSPHNILSRT